MIRNLVIAIFICLAQQSGFVSAQCSLDKSQWELFWAEEFDQPDLATFKASGKWLFDSGLSWVDYRTSDAASFCSGDFFSLNHRGYGVFRTEPLDVNFSTGDAKRPVAHIICRSAGLTSNWEEFPDFNGLGKAAGFLYGMFEIRCKLTRQPTQGYPNFIMVGNQWPPEIDAFEYHSGDDNFFSSVHYDSPIGCNPRCDKGSSDFYYFPSMHLYDDFHTWTIVWTPEQISWFFDGKELKTDKEPSHQPGADLWHDTIGNSTTQPDPMQWITWNQMRLKVGYGLLWSAPGSSPDSFVVDYVRIYKPKGYEPDNRFSWTSPKWSGHVDWYYNHLLPLYRGAGANGQIVYKSPYDCEMPLASNLAAASLHPNPTNSRLDILLPGGLGLGKYSVIDMLGRSVMNGLMSSGLTLSIDVSALPDGIYQIALRFEDQSKVLRFVKL